VSSDFRETALAMKASGLLAKGYDTIVIDGGWSDHQHVSMGHQHVSPNGNMVRLGWRPALSRAIAP
jgi:hypothetical protein